MNMDKNINIITDLDGTKIVLINDIRFALPVYNCKTGTLERYNIYKSTMLVRHADDNNKYLYDFIGIRKEMSSPLESKDCTVKTHFL